MISVVCSHHNSLYLKLIIQFNCSYKSRKNINVKKYFVHTMNNKDLKDKLRQTRKALNIKTQALLLPRLSLLLKPLPSKETSSNNTNNKINQSN